MRDAFSLEEADRLGQSLEEVLRRYSIDIKTGGTLEALLLAVVEAIQLWRTEQEDLPWSTSDRASQVIGIADLARCLLGVEHHPDFRELVPHLELLNRSSGIQTGRADFNDRDSNKLFELYVASLVMEIGTNVRLDDPEHATGENPDILATIDGTRWGFACKVPYSKAPKTLFERVQEGIQQLERSEAEVGVVVVSGRNTVDRDRAWPKGPKADLREVVEFLDQHAFEIKRDLVEVGGKRTFADLFRSKKSVSGFLWHGHVVAQTVWGGRRRPTSVNRLMGIQAGGFLAKEFAIFEALNDRAQWSPRQRT